MAAGLTGSDEYSAGLHWSDPEEREGAARDVVAAVVAEIDARYPTIDWRSTAAALGHQPASDTEATSPR